VCSVNRGLGLVTAHAGEVKERDGPTFRRSQILILRRPQLWERPTTKQSRDF